MHCLPKRAHSRSQAVATLLLCTTSGAVFAQGAAVPASDSQTPTAVAQASSRPVQTSQAPQFDQLPTVTVVQGATLQTKQAPARDRGREYNATSSPLPKSKAPGAVKSEDAPPAPKKAAQSSTAKFDGGGGKGGGGAGGSAVAEGGAASAGGAAGGEDGSSSGLIATNKLGTAVSVVTRQEIEQRQLRTVVDAIRALPGVAVTMNGPFGTLAEVHIRGGEPRHTLVVVDGVELNSPLDGSFDFSNLMTDDVERIELLRGPQSGIYGSNAIAGVINIVTRSGRGPLTVRLSGEGGSLNTKAGAMQISGGTDEAWGSVSLSRRQNDGFNISTVGNEKDAMTLNTATLTGGFKVFDGLVVDGTWRRSVLNNARDAWGLETDTKGFYIPSDDGSTSRRQIDLGRIAATLELLDKHLVSTAYASQAKNIYHDDDRTFVSLFDTRNELNTYGFTSTYRLDGPGNLPVRHFFTSLYERRNETFTQTEPQITDKERNRSSFAGEIRGEYFRDLNIAASVRRDDNDDSVNYTTWHAQGSYHIPGTILRLHSSGGTGVKYATLSDLYGQYSHYDPNPNLKPETSIGWDAGAEATLWRDRAVVDVTYFNWNSENAFRAVGYPGTTINVAGITHREGIEVAMRARLTESIVTTAAYTYTDTRDPDGFELIRRPKHTGKVGVDWTFAEGRGHLGGDVAYTGVQLDTVFSGPFYTQSLTELKDYWLGTVKASYKLTTQMELFGRVENVFNQHYQDVYGYNATSGVTAYGGVRFTFEDKATTSWAQYRD